MAKVEFFHYVGRGVLYDDFFALSRIVGAVLGLSRYRMVESIHLVENLANHVCGIDSKV